LPALSNARARARAASCSNNLKQVGLVSTMYAGDFDDWLPGGRNTSNVPTPAWYNSLADYLPSPKTAGTTHGHELLICPDNKYSSNTAYGPVVGSRTGYGMCAGGMKSSSPVAPSFAKLTRLKLPGRLPYWLEIDNSGNSYGVDASSTSANGIRWNLYHTIHMLQSNVCFVDGHVKLVSSMVWDNAGPTASPWAYNFCDDYAKPQW